MGFLGLGTKKAASAPATKPGTKPGGIKGKLTFGSKSPSPKKAAKPAPKRGGGGMKLKKPTTKETGAGLRTSSGLFVPPTQTGFFAQQKGDNLWYPNAKRPSWLDGKMPGDVGFDPLELSKQTEYLNVSIDQDDITARKNVQGTVSGAYKKKAPQTSSLSPYSEIFNLDRFRECELIHGRWAMAAILGIVIAENQTGISWVDAGQVEMDQAQYANVQLPLSVSALTGIEFFLMGSVEVLRNSEADPEMRCYPGGNFDPLNLAADKSTIFNLRTAEIKHARLAMIGMLALIVKALATGNGAFLNPNP